MHTALVLLSGGQDSTTCLMWALSTFKRVETLGFDYGQRHAVELECRQDILDHFRRTYGSAIGEDYLVSLDAIKQISDTSLTNDKAITIAESGLPTTFVPGRNVFFLTTAAAIAYRRGIEHIVAGMCETDYSGYPDCRHQSIEAIEHALRYSLDYSELRIHTPLMWIDKAETWKMAERLGGSDFVRFIIEHTHTCYLGDHVSRHEWGYGCGECPACRIRAEGWKKYREQEAATPAGT